MFKQRLLSVLPLLMLALTAWADPHSPGAEDGTQQQAEQWKNKGGEQTPFLPDPLSPSIALRSEPTAPAVQPSLPRLTMIVRYPNRHYAMIDGQPRRVGDEVDGYRVRAIQTGSVLLEQEDGQTVELELIANSVRKKPIPTRGHGIPEQSEFRSK